MTSSSSLLTETAHQHDLEAYFEDDAYVYYKCSCGYTTQKPKR